MIRLMVLTAALTLTACQTTGSSRMSGEAAFAKLPTACFMRADLGDNAKYEMKENGATTMHLIMTHSAPYSREIGCLCNEHWRMDRVSAQDAEKALRLIADEGGMTLQNFRSITGSTAVYIYEAKRIDMWGDTSYHGRAVFEGRCMQMISAWGRPSDATVLAQFAASAYDVRQGRPATTPTATPTPSAMESRSIAVRWEGITELMAGTVQFEERAGTGRVAFAFPDKSATCSGTFQAKDRTSGAWSLACSNGKAASGSYKALGAGQGSVGEGKDLDGKAVQFTVGARG